MLRMEGRMGVKEGREEGRNKGRKEGRISRKEGRNIHLTPEENIFLLKVTDGEL